MEIVTQKTDQHKEEVDDKPVLQANTGNNARASWQISLGDLRANISHCTPDKRAIIVDCFLWCIQNNVTKAEFARGIGSSDNTLYKIITGKYTNPHSGERLEISAKMAEDMRRWLDNEKAKAATESAFLLTPTAKRVFQACDLAKESRTPVFLTGPSHIGKTTALLEWAKRNNHGRTIYVRMEAAGGLGRVMQVICERVGQSPKCSRDKMRNGLYNALSSDMTLLIDEFHLLLHTYRIGSFIECAEFIRDIYDKVQCGIVLSMTDFGREKVIRDRKVELEQIIRRGAHKIRLHSEPTVEDVKMILEHAGLQMPGKKDTITVAGIVEQPYEILRQLAKDQGLKSITERIRYAKKLARREQRDLEWDDFVKAHLIILSNDQIQSGGWE